MGLKYLVWKKRNPQLYKYESFLQTLKDKGITLQKENTYKRRRRDAQIRKRKQTRK